MLKLVLAQASIGDTLELGPFKEVRLGSTQASGDGRPIAVHRDHCWHAGGREYFRIDCSKSVMAHFENEKGERSGELGPFVHFSSADGIAYGDGWDFAHIDPRENVWYFRKDGTQWQALVLVPE